MILKVSFPSVFTCPYTLAQTLAKIFILKWIQYAAETTTTALGIHCTRGNSNRSSKQPHGAIYVLKFKKKEHKHKVKKMKSWFSRRDIFVDITFGINSSKNNSILSLTIGNPIRRKDGYQSKLQPKQMMTQSSYKLHTAMKMIETHLTH